MRNELIVGLSGIALGAVLSAVGWWAKDRRQLTREQRTAARLLESELLAAAVQVEWLWVRFMREVHFMNLTVSTAESFGVDEADIQARRHEALEEWLPRVHAVTSQLPERIPTRFEQWQEHSPALAPAMRPDRWRAVRTAYASIETLRLMPDLLSRDLPHLEAHSAWTDALSGLRNRLEAALDALAETAGDRRSGWKEAIADVERFFDTTVLGSGPSPGQDAEDQASPGRDDPATLSPSKSGH